MMRRQRIVIKVQMNREECRVKVMKIIAKAQGVTSMAVEGPDRDRVVIIGSGIDCVKLTAKLRKNVGHATVECVQNMNIIDNNINTQDDEDNTFYASSSCYCSTRTTATGYSQLQSQPQLPVYNYHVVQDPYQSNNCSIM